MAVAVAIFVLVLMGGDGLGRNFPFMGGIRGGYMK
jgi:hypothetical protein